MPFKVVHGQQGKPVGISKGLGERKSHQKRTDQPRPLGSGHGIKHFRLQAGFR